MDKNGGNNKMRSKILDGIMKNRKAAMKRDLGDLSFEEPQFKLPHRTWPQLPQPKTALFSECTLFLYSIFALFIQYLNLYKTLWWLPKSHWHGVFKTYLINPYVLSCIGLLLGLRVTKCFWQTITKRMDSLNPKQDSVFWSIVEYAIIKSPLGTMITVSFTFSMSRIIMEYGHRAALMLILPVLIQFAYYLLVEIWDAYQCSLNQFHMITTLVKRFIDPQFYYNFGIDKEEKFREHLCSDTMEDYMYDAEALYSSIKQRFVKCLFIAFYTSYYAIYMPIYFVPVKTTSGLTQHFYCETVWYEFMCINVFFTTFFIYFPYQFPMDLIDTIYKVTCHLGRWKEDANQTEQPVVTWDKRDYKSKWSFKHCSKVEHNGKYYIGYRHPHYDRVASMPNSPGVTVLYNLGSNPPRFFLYLCVGQAFLILLQFHNLIMATDWQHICTLVMLMFANYVSIFVYLRECVVVSHVYSDSRKTPDDKALPLHGGNLYNWTN